MILQATHILPLYDLSTIRWRHRTSSMAWALAWPAFVAYCCMSLTISNTNRFKGYSLTNMQIYTPNCIKLLLNFKRPSSRKAAYLGRVNPFWHLLPTVTRPHETTSTLFHVEYTFVTLDNDNCDEISNERHLALQSGDFGNTSKEIIKIPYVTDKTHYPFNNKQGQTKP